MHNQAPEAGLASLLSSRGRNGDSVLVHMSPKEVAGLQRLAMAHGGSLTINPETGLYEASFLKKILPQIVGAVLPSVPGLGDFTKTIGFGNEALGSALIVGGATGLIEGDLKKGLMAGLGAYSGASIASGLKAAAGVGAPAGAESEAPTSQVSTKAAGATFAPVSAKDQILYGGAAPRGFDVDTTRAANWAASNTPAGAAPIQAATTVKPPTSFLGTMGQGLKNIFTTKEGAGKFMEGLGGGYKSPIGQTLSRYATFAGAALPFAEEPSAFPTGGAGGDELVYIPTKYDPTQSSVFQAQGQYYRRTPQGLVPYNPWALAPKGRGFAYGGTVQSVDQQRAIPHNNPTFPYPNQNYPLSTVTGTPYQNLPIGSNPQPREIIGNYEPNVDVFTGEQRFADGGAVTDPNILATRSYIEELNRRARMGLGGVGVGTAGTAGGLGAFGPQTLPPATAGGAASDAGAVSGPGVGDIVGGIAANYLINKGIGAGVDYLRGQMAASEADKLGVKYGQPTDAYSDLANQTIDRAKQTPLEDGLQGVDINTLPTTTAALAALNPFSIAPAPLPPTRTVIEPLSYEGNEFVVREDPTVTQPTVTQPTTAPSTIPYTSAALAGLSAASPFMDISPLPPTRTVIEPLSYEGDEFVVREDPTVTQPTPAPALAPTSAIPYSPILSAVSPFAAAAPSTAASIELVDPVTGQMINPETGELMGPAERQPGQLDADLQAKTQISGDVSAPLSSYLSGASSLGAGLAGLANAGKVASIGIQLPIYDSLGNLIGFGSSAPGAASAVGSAATGASSAATGAGTAGAEAAGVGAGTNTLTGKIIPGIQTALGAYETFKGIESGNEARAALGAYGTSAGLGSLMGFAGAGPIGLAAAAIAAIGASMVNTKEFGDKALENYWKAVDQGRGFGAAPPEELAQGFINFYRTNKNQFAGQEKYGRTGNEDFVYDMTQVINDAVKSGKVGKDVDAATMYKDVVQPWLNSMGSGPQNDDAKRIQDFMMTDLIHNFMYGKPISNAQVKGDTKYKIVSEKPVYAGAPPEAPDWSFWHEMSPEDAARNRPMEAVSPYAAVEDTVLPRRAMREEAAQMRMMEPTVEQPMPMPQQEVISPFSPPPVEDYIRQIIEEQGPVAAYRTLFGRGAEQVMPMPEQEVINPYMPEPVEQAMPMPESEFLGYAEPYNPYAGYLPSERETRFAMGGAIGDDYNFGFAGGGMSEYKAGGKLLNGPGDGMSDDIPAVIRGKGVQRAALADGEFVVPADVVSHLGNGSTKAGAKKLYDMMAKIRKARTGKTSQAPAVKTDRFLPA